VSVVKRIQRAGWFQIVLAVLLALLLLPLVSIYLVEECSSEDGQTLLALTFDDGYGSWSSNIMPTLAHYDLPATAFINDPDTRDSFTWADVKELYDAGWEIGWHTAEHINMREADRSLRSSVILRTSVPCSKSMDYQPPLVLHILLGSIIIVQCALYLTTSLPRERPIIA